MKNYGVSVSKIKTFLLWICVFPLSAMAAPTQICSGGRHDNCSLAGIEGNVKNAFGSGADILYVIAALIGIVFVIAGLFKAKSHSMDMQGTQGGSKQAVVMITIGAALIAIPVIMLASSTTLFGDQHIVLPTESNALAN